MAVQKYLNFIPRLDGAVGRLRLVLTEGGCKKFAGLITFSIGKKLFMALTGLCFICFLAVHLVGNLTLYGGPGPFNAYVSSLESLGPLVTVAEIGLVLLAVVHIGTGLLLFYLNLRARPVRYRVYTSAGGRTIGSATMPYTGLIILGFVIFHLADFTMADRTGTTLYDIVASAFSNPVHSAFYVFIMVVVAVHVSHGFWSLFQTLGMNHVKYTAPIQVLGILVSIVFGAGFGLIPIALYLFV
ncbi:MAG TPA: succinate dehydrogenase cytochrome b subunit [Desulfobacteraceae bacterium]|nr:succinate dehydrogenase cytochrome b subunit [Desulfobacteraceae bacterium]